jgi:hypothetical protein
MSAGSLSKVKVSDITLYNLLCFSKKLYLNKNDTSEN